MLLFQYLSARVDGLIDHIDEVGTGFIVNHARLESPQVVETTEEVLEYAEPEAVEG